jgi:hypothetical protein
MATLVRRTHFFSDWVAQSGSCDVGVDLVLRDLQAGGKIALRAAGTTPQRAGDEASVERISEVSEPLLFSCSSAFAHPAQLKNESVDDFP